jgi:hypothetical protein
MTTIFRVTSPEAIPFNQIQLLEKIEFAESFYGTIEFFLPLVVITSPETCIPMRVRAHFI